MKKRLAQLLTGSALFLAAILIDYQVPWLRVMLFLLPYFVLGYDVITKAMRSIGHGDVFNENFLMGIATIGAFCIGEYPEGVAVMLFYQLGELFQDYAVNKSRKSIASLMDIRPDYANVLREGEYVRLDPEEVSIGEEILIKPGEKIPLDAIVVSGSSTVDTSALTGESIPQDVTIGRELLSGCINLSGALTARVTKEFGESTVSKILDLVENASSKKSSSESFITRFARFYTPCVVFLAVALAIIPPLLMPGTFRVWLYRALSFLVVSCPCALVISVPLSFFGGIGGAARQGILVKGGTDLESLAKTQTVVFDKTGTLTKGVFRVQEVHPVGVTQEELLFWAAYAEIFSNHPIAQSLRQAYGKEMTDSRVSEAQEIPGKGISALVDGRQVFAGNLDFMLSLGFSPDLYDTGSTVVFVCLEDRYIGCVAISDEIKPDAKAGIIALDKAGVRKTVMLTGDAKAVAEKVCKQLGLTEAHAQLLPQDKVARLEALLKEQPSDSKLAFVGDGINDAPVLARADVGVAMGGLGSDAAIEAADVVIMTDEPSKLADAIAIAKRTVRIANQNIVFALVVKIAVLLLCMLGLANMWAAVFADVGVTVLAIINALRALSIKRN